MKKDKIKLYFLEILFLLALFITIFVSSNISRLNMSLILLVGAIITICLFKKKRIISIYYKKVLLLMTALGLLYVGFFYLLGFFFYKFSNQMVIFNIKTIIHFIIPYTIIIISSELIRFILISQDGKIRIRNTNYDYSKVIVFIIMILIDLSIYIGLYDLKSLDDFLALTGFVIFASISCNLFYNYYSKRFGYHGIIVFRMITVLYAYIIPIVPNMYIYFRSFLRMLYPYLMYLIIEYSFGSGIHVESYSSRKNNALMITISIITMTIITMLISCQFKYGVLIVGSNSMKGSLNKGDATLFERYDHQQIKTGDIIIFNYKDIKLIHRIIEIKKVNGEIRIFTKGDANKINDPEYRVEKDIVGVSKLKIKYIGMPTLWLRSLFE